jgi:hypothetical protein
MTPKLYRRILLLPRRKAKKSQASSATLDALVPPALAEVHGCPHAPQTIMKTENQFYFLFVYSMPAAIRHLSL